MCNANPLPRSSIVPNQNSSVAAVEVQVVSVKQHYKYYAEYYAESDRTLGFSEAIASKNLLYMSFKM